MRTKLLTAPAAGGAVLLSTLALGGTAAATGYGSGHHHDNRVSGRLNPLNYSRVTGHAHVKVEGKKLDVHYRANNLARNLPHAAHSHYGEQATHACPTVRDDKNRDFRLDVVEGVPRYVPIAVSLTTKATPARPAVRVSTGSPPPRLGSIDSTAQS